MPRSDWQTNRPNPLEHRPRATQKVVSAEGWKQKTLVSFRSELFAGLDSIGLLFGQIADNGQLEHLPLVGLENQHQPQDKAR
jgi:hypothetical protein